jgi:hypothetical protein
MSPVGKPAKSEALQPKFVVTNRGPVALPVAGSLTVIEPSHGSSVKRSSALPAASYEVAQHPAGTERLPYSMQTPGAGVRRRRQTDAAGHVIHFGAIDELRTSLAV